MVQLGRIRLSSIAMKKMVHYSLRATERSWKKLTEERGLPRQWWDIAYPLAVPTRPYPSTTSPCYQEIWELGYKLWRESKGGK